MTPSPETIQSPSVALIVAAMTLLLSAGCGPGTGQGLDENGNLPATTAQPNGGAAGGGVGASGNPDATLAWVQTNVFGSICSLCHAGASAPLGLDWSSAAHICGNVAHQSVEISTMKEIATGNPDASYMIWKIQGAGPTGQPIVGGQMPLGLTPLPAATIQNMRDWVADGLTGC